MPEVGLHLIVGDLIGRPVVERGEPSDRPQIRFARPVATLPSEHVVVHLSTRFCYDAPPLSRTPGLAFVSGHSAMRQAGSTTEDGR